MDFDSQKYSIVEMASIAAQEELMNAKLD